jgi:GT2 family glycosyltransferase
MTVAVVILNFNGEKLLRTFLPSVIEYSGEATIYVIDNASTDRSVEIVRNEFSNVILIELKENFGFCGGYNRGLAHVVADLFVLLNSDVEVTPGWLSPIEKIFQEDPAIAAVQPKILSYHDKERFEYAGAGGGFIDTLGYPFCRGRLFDFTEVDRGQYNDTREIFWATGACMIVRAEVFRKLGGLDEDFFAHMEEIDLCWKINRTGSKVFYCGESRVYHVGAGTLSYESARKTYLNYRNGLVLIYKHLGPYELYFKVTLRVMLDWVAAGMYLVKGKSQNAGSVFKAHRDFMGSLHKHRVKRRQIRAQSPSYPDKNIYHGLAIVQYFLRGKKYIRVNNPR